MWKSCDRKKFIKGAKEATSSICPAEEALAEVIRCWKSYRSIEKEEIACYKELVATKVNYFKATIYRKLYVGQEAARVASEKSHQHGSSVGLVISCRL